MSNKSLKTLKALSHSLKPIVILGAQGLTDAVHQEIEQALEAHELIKIRINARDTEERQAYIQAICDKHQAQLINKIGHIIVIYKKTSNT